LRGQAHLIESKIAGNQPAPSGRAEFDHDLEKANRPPSTLPVERALFESVNVSNEQHAQE
jgi:hypothetical protein